MLDNNTDNVELLEKYKELVPLILMALAQIQTQPQAQAQAQAEPVTTPEPAPEPAPAPEPVAVTTPVPESETTPAVPMDLVMQAVKQYMATAAPPIVQTSSNVIPKTIKDVDELLKNHPLVIK